MKEDQKLKDLVLSFLSDDFNSLDDIENNIKEAILSFTTMELNRKLCNDNLSKKDF